MRYILPFLLVLCAYGQTFAFQTSTGTVRGNVYDKESTQPISYATVRIESLNKGANTDINGFFTISGLPPGTYDIKVSYIGYETVVASVTVNKGEIEYVTLNMLPSNKIDEIVVSGKKAAAQNNTQVSKLSVSPKEIRSLPSAGGQADIAQYLTVLPGVIFTGDQGGQLYIRGGSPVQNRILLDGMTIYNPFHSIGFFSVYETELIRNVDVYTGGFNAEYGGRISAVVDVKTREGNRKRLAGLVSASPFQARAIIEGPLVPLKEAGGGSISFVLAGKKSLINQVDKQLYPYVNENNALLKDSGIPFDYQDAYGKLSLLTGNGSKMNIFGFRYTDRVDFPVTDFSWNTWGAGLDFTIIPTNSSTIIDGKFTYSSYDTKIEESSIPRSSLIDGYFGSLNFTNFAGNTEVRYGIELTGFQTDFVFVNFLNFETKQQDFNTEIAGYLKAKFKSRNLVAEPGVRLQYYQSISRISPEPRLGLKYILNKNIRLKAAAGLYTQNLLSTVNERDVVNLFVGFLSAPQSEIFDPNAPNKRTTDRLQRAIHYVAGTEVDVTDKIDVNIEVYYKDFTQLLALNRFKTKQNEPDYFVETGYAQGIDATIKYEGRRANMWASYSLGYVRRNDGQQEYAPVFDRRHNMNMVFSYQLGKKKNIEAGIRYNFGSGFPFTLTQGFYTYFDYSDGINTDITTGNPDYGVIYAAQRNTGRLPFYHRVDLSVKYQLKLGRYAKADITAAVTNALDRPNIFYFDRVNYVRVNQLPILPSLSATFEF